ncbi:alpha/beta hydrolase family protein [Flavitalea flava]
MKPIFLLAFFAILGFYSHSQNISGTNEKQEIDLPAIENWPEVGGVNRISPDGNYLLYSIHNQPTGKSTLIAQSIDNFWKREFIGWQNGEISEDSRWAVLKKGDSLCLLSLGKDTMAYLSHIGQFELFIKNKDSWLAYIKNTEEKELILRDLHSGQENTFTGVTGFQLDTQKKALIWQSQKVTSLASLFSLHYLNLMTSQEQLIVQDAPMPVSNYVFNDPGGDLLYIKIEPSETDTLYSLHWYEASNNKEKLIWKDRLVPGAYVFDQTGDQLAFFSGDTLWYYKKGMEKMLPLSTNYSPGIDKDLKLNTQETLLFSKDGNQLFFYLVEKPTAMPPRSDDMVKVDVWNYRDKELQSVQLMSAASTRSSFAAVLAINAPKVRRMEEKGEKLWDSFWEVNHYALLFPGERNIREWWQTGSQPSFTLLSLTDGSRKSLQIDTRYISPVLLISPHDDYVIYYDPAADAYCSYQINKGIIRQLTKGSGVSWKREQYRYYNTPNPYFGVDPRPAGIAGWVDGDNSLLVYESYDIWKLDPSGTKAPVNVTNGYGRKHHIKFEFFPISPYSNQLSSRESWILGAFNEDNKQQGFYRIIPEKKGDPELLIMSPYSIGHPEKARDVQVWVTQRTCFSDAPNLYETKDFKTYTRLSNNQPQKDYNWYTTELVNWQLPDGDTCQGLLFKPGNFDPKKKYPLLFNYYETSSQGAFAYFPPALAASCNINVPYFVSRGYLVFMPDIHYRIGYPGESALNSVVSAAKILSQRPYVDSTKMGLAGHSWGGYETNYIITHSHLFVAAAEGAGPSDFIGDYNGIDGVNGIGFSKQWVYEVAQSRMGCTLWQNPKLYWENSPIIKANQVTTPLLILHNKGDKAVPWAQGVELFTALRRLGRRAWMLQYDGEDHSLFQEKNIKDYTIRLTQFFDHYLKGVSAPLWMTEGIPASKK